MDARGDRPLLPSPQAQQQAPASLPARPPSAACACPRAPEPPAERPQILLSLAQVLCARDGDGALRAARCQQGSGQTLQSVQPARRRARLASQPSLLQTACRPPTGQQCSAG